MFNEVDARSSDRIDKTSGAREGHPLDRAAGGALTPRGATVPRERSFRQLVERQSRLRQENSWRFRVDLAMSVSHLCPLDKGGSRDARRFLRPAMAWQ